MGSSSPFPCPLLFAQAQVLAGSPPAGTWCFWRPVSLVALGSSPYRAPASRPPPRAFRVTRCMRAWVRWTRRGFYNRAQKHYRCAWCLGTFLAPNDHEAHKEQVTCGMKAWPRPHTPRSPLDPA